MANNKIQPWQMFIQDYAEAYDMIKQDYNKILTRTATQEDKYIAIIKRKFRHEIKDLPYELVNIRIEKEINYYAWRFIIQVKTLCNYMNYSTIIDQVELNTAASIETILHEYVRKAIHTAIDYDAEHINDEN